MSKALNKKHVTPLQRALREILRENNVPAPSRIADECIAAFEKLYELAPIRNVRRNDEVVTMEIRSRSDARRWYFVRLNGQISLDNYCSCEAALNGALCWHLRYGWKIARFLQEGWLI